MTMTRDETKKILITMQRLYPNFQPEDLTGTIDAWAVVMEDCSYRDAETAVKSYAKSNNSAFAPSPGQLISIIEKMNLPEPMNDEEAFGMVMKAIERSSWHSEEEFEKLPPILRKTVGDSNQLKDWAQMTVEEIERYVQPNVIRTYRSEVQREQEYARLPEEARRRIDAVNSRNKYEGRLLEPVNE